LPVEARDHPAGLWARVLDEGLLDGESLQTPGRGTRDNSGAAPTSH